MCPTPIVRIVVKVEYLICLNVMLLLGHYIIIPVRMVRLMGSILDMGILTKWDGIPLVAPNIKRILPEIFMTVLSITIVMGDMILVKV